MLQCLRFCSVKEAVSKKQSGSPDGRDLPCSAGERSSCCSNNVTPASGEQLPASSNTSAAASTASRAALWLVDLPRCTGCDHDLALGQTSRRIIRVWSPCLGATTRFEKHNALDAVVETRPTPNKKMRDGERMEQGASKTKILADQIGTTSAHGLFCHRLMRRHTPALLRQELQPVVAGAHRGTARTAQKAVCTPREYPGGGDSFLPRLAANGPACRSGTTLRGLISNDCQC